MNQKAGRYDLSGHTNLIGAAEPRRFDVRGTSSRMYNPPNYASTKIYPMTNETSWSLGFVTQIIYPIIRDGPRNGMDSSVE